MVSASSPVGFIHGMRGSFRSIKCRHALVSSAAMPLTRSCVKQVFSNDPTWLEGSQGSFYMTEYTVHP